MPGLPSHLLMRRPELVDLFLSLVFAPYQKDPNTKMGAL